MFSNQVMLVAALAIGLTCAGCHSNPTNGYKDHPQLTPLMNAARHNDLARVRRLLGEGADVKARTAQGETALYEAIYRADQEQDNLPVVDALLKAGADPDEKEFATPLILSLDIYGNPSVTLRLLQAGAHVSHDCPPQNSEDSLVSLGTMDSSTEVMRELIAKGSPVNCQFNGATALYWAALNGQGDRVALLLKSGADPRQQDLDAAKTSSSDSRVQGDFAKTHQLLEQARNTRELK